MRGISLARHHGVAYPSFVPAGVLKLLAILLLLIAALDACRTAPVPAVAPVAAAPVVGDRGRGEECELAPGPVAAAGTLTVALPGSVDPAHAPVPASDAERLVFPQLYEPLVHIDCAGRMVPGLAESWSVYSGGRRWTFTLRHDAQFWDGAPVTAQDVLSSWRTRAPLLARHTVAPSSRELRVDPPGSLPVTWFAEAALVVTKPAPDGGWPIGAGAYWASGRTVTDALVAQPVSKQGTPLAAVAFREFAGTDPRDLLDQGVNLLLTDDPTVVTYAATGPQLFTVALPWSRRYLLVAPSGAAPDSLERQDLARAVHAEARAGTGLACLPPDSSDAATAVPILPPRRLVYDRTDPTARELAERLVARGVLGAGVPAVGLAPADFVAARRGNNARAYVIAVPFATACDILTITGETRVQPLIDTRSYAVVRRGMPRLLLDADGTVRLMPR